MIKNLSSPLKDKNGYFRVFFAGEAYDRQNFGQLSGALRSAYWVSYVLINMKGEEQKSQREQSSSLSR